LHIENGVIERIAEYGSDDPTGAKLFNAGHDVVSPGLVDTHVHINEPGRTDWEGFDTATRAAAAGGVTTVVDMPLNSVPATTSVDALRAKREAAQSQCHIDVAFWGGLVPGNVAELDPMIDAGVRGFKCFLVPSGVDEFPAVGEADLRAALPVLARRGVPLLVHAEWPALIISDLGVRNADSIDQPNPQSSDPQSRLRSLDDRASYGEARQSARGATAAEIRNPQSYATYLASRPASAELEAIRLMVRLAGEFKTRIHIVHVSSAEGVDAIAAAKAGWAPVSAETCPHYLTFSAEEIPDAATELKCAPPIRTAAHRDALWAGLGSGALDMVVTDHSPSRPELKRPGGVGDFLAAWGGIASLQLSLPATYTALKAQLSRLNMQGSEVNPFALLARWMSAAPASLAGLGERKGRIEPGCDADLVVWNPEATFVVDPAQLRHRHKLTPYAGRTLMGAVLTTFVRGERVWDRNRLARAYDGRLL
jgi:allantoinase